MQTYDGFQATRLGSGPGHRAEDMFELLRNILFQAMHTGIYEKLDSNGLTFMQRSILLHISRSGGSTPGEISRALSIRNSALPRMIQSLERRKLIIRSENKSDRRKRCLQVSSQGRELLRRVNKNPVEQVSKLMLRLPPGEQKTVWKGLEILFKEMKTIEA
jgi:DNA-binding MarR family transcriptional regulator